MVEIKEIDDKHFLYRRIHPSQYNNAKAEISSCAFIDPKASVDWALYTTPEETIKGYPTHHLASLKAEIPRAKDQKVIHDPCPDTDPDNYSHTLIIGRKSRSVARFIARNCEVVIKRT